MKVHITPRALDELAGLVSFVEGLHGIVLAVELNDEVFSACYGLADQPYLGSGLSLRGSAPYRQLIIRNLTVVLYRIEGDEVVIHKIRDIRSDWKK